jgi:peptide/nickel transport system ATP-binding protein
MTATLPTAAELAQGAAVPLVSIRGLDVGYVRNRRVQPAVVGLDLTVGVGEIVAVVGESGSGKTTTANAVIGLLPRNGRVTGGSAVVDGVETAGASEKALRRLRGSVVGLIPQDPMVGLNPTQRVGTQIAEAVRLRGVRGPDVEREVLELLGEAGIPDPETRIRQYPHELSGGLRQRVLIAIALAGRPRLIIADEPTSALDVTVQKRILDHLAGLVRDQGISLLVITHDLAVAADRADRVVVMQRGRVVEEGDPRSILVDPQHDYTRKLIAAAPGLSHGGRIVPRFQVRREELPAPILTLIDVSKTFPVRDRRQGARGFNALEGVSLQVPRGRTHALVGESGCGKTTTLRIAMGLEPATRGSIELDGTDVTALSWRRFRPLRRKVQLVHQNPFAALDPRYTIKQSITEPLVAFGVGDRRSRTRRARELLDAVSLPTTFLDRLPTELSGGQRQRVAIARALALEPELLMLDEPVSALDVSVQEQILELLAGLQADLGLSYLFVSHDLAVVSEISHTVSVMQAGKVVEEGPVCDVFTKPEHPYTRELIDAIPGQRGAAAVTAREAS